MVTFDAHQVLGQGLALVQELEFSRCAVYGNLVSQRSELRMQVGHISG